MSESMTAAQRLGILRCKIPVRTLPLGWSAACSTKHWDQGARGIRGLNPKQAKAKADGEHFFCFRSTATLRQVGQAIDGLAFSRDPEDVFGGPLSAHLGGFQKAFSGSLFFSEVRGDLGFDLLELRNHDSDFSQKMRRMRRDPG